ncbi:hypothetical protein, partial, partial [Absidia glauca]
AVVYLDTPPDAAGFRAQYKIADTLKPVVHEAVQKWEAQGIITRVPSNVDNRWNSPLTLAPKKDSSGKYTAKRPCLDPRHINKYLKEDRFPLPKIGDIFLKLKDAVVYTTLDLTNAFHRFPIHPPDQHKTAFTSVDGLQYMFRGCPFGLKPISSKFQRVMTTLFSRDPFHSFVATFVDDIVIYSKTYNSHAAHVKMVIDELTQVNLTLNPQKCHFAQKTIYLLGFCVKANGESTLDMRKVTNVQEWPQPVTGKQIQQFLGLVNYFRLYIPYFADLTAPLDALRSHDDYQFEVVHLPGFKNILPDQLSRLFPTAKDLGEQSVSDQVTLDDSTAPQHIKMMRATHKAYLEDNHMEPPTDKEKKEVLVKAHLFGHFGADAIVKAIHNNGMHWTNLRKEALELVQNCVPCQSYLVTTGQ